ncbi:hypothetical protein C8R45DRAFT_942652 [Mycena sanguinolenta]|nr:hypothetical protein C8R45DRAFT_942652 [Mycena sanguinolenta]
MPRKKGQAKAQNLGDFALKRKGDKVQQSDEVQPRKRSRNASPNDSSMDSGDNQQNADTNPFNNSDSETESEAEIEIQEEDDIPHPTDQADLLRWLQLSDAHLNSLPTTTAPVRRGAYHSRKIGVDISVRREQELQKLEKERAARESKQDLKHGWKKTAITDFFSRQPLSQPSAQEPELEPDSPDEESFVSDAEMEIDSEGRLLLEESAETAASLPNSDRSDSEVEEYQVDQVSSSHASVVNLSDSDESEIVEQIMGKSSTSRVTLEVVEDEDDIPLNVEPCELSPEARAEEGLDELPWDPSQDVYPRAADSPQLVEQLPEPPPTQPLTQPPTQPLPPGTSILTDEDVAGDIHLHLQSLGKWASAKDIVRYVATPEFQARLSTEEQIDFDAKMRAFMSSALDARVVIWRHDESTFYCHDRRDLRWVHKSERAKIKAKGQGASQMVGDFVSDVYGWLKSKKPNADG